MSAKVAILAVATVALAALWVLGAPGIVQQVGGVALIVALAVAAWQPGLAAHYWVESLAIFGALAALAVPASLFVASFFVAPWLVYVTGISWKRLQLQVQSVKVTKNG